MSYRIPDGMSNYDESYNTIVSTNISTKNKIKLINIDTIIALKELIDDELCTDYAEMGEDYDNGFNDCVGKVLSLLDSKHAVLYKEVSNDILKQFSDREVK